MRKNKYFIILVISLFTLISLQAESSSSIYDEPEIPKINLDLDRLPVIESLKPSRSNIAFREYQSIIESNAVSISSGKTPEYIFFKYTNTEGFTFQRLAARCCITQDTLATINQISSGRDDIDGKTLILPTVNGLFVPTGKGKSSLEQLLQENYNTKILTKANFCYTIEGRDYLFFQNKKFSPTERTYFLDNSLCLPLDVGTYWVSSEFGRRKNPLSGKIKNHNGIDLAAPTGTPVHAIKDGSAYYCIHNDPTFGNYIILGHDEGKMTSVYAHLSKIEVKRYQSVKKGDIIGYVGETGMATGPHLHFEIRQGGVAEDPRLKLKLGD